MGAMKEAYATLEGLSVIVATLDTSHFTFQAVGRDREEAEAAMVAGFRRHCREYTGADRAFMRNAIIDGEVRFAEIPIGGAARDGEPL